MNNLKMIEKTIWSSAKTELKKFFDGKIYPITVGALVLLSHIFALEIFINFVSVTLCAVSFWVSDSVKPFIPVLCTYVYRVSGGANVLHPTEPDYLFGGFRLVFITALFLFAFISAICFFLRFREQVRRSLQELPMLIPATLMSCAFIFNGAFSDSQSISSLLYGVALVAVYFVLFYFFTLGLYGESGEKLTEYFAFVTLIMAVVLILETVHLYLSCEGLFLNGAVVKERIYYGWGNWNTVGQQMVMTLPMLFYGVMKMKGTYVYFSVALLTSLCVAFTLSRNALLMSVLFFTLLSICSCFFGERKKQMRFLIPILAICLLMTAFMLRHRLSEILADYIERGFSDNGRFYLWKKSFSAFTEAPLFGKGFFGLFPPRMQDKEIFPIMAHNTFFELLGAMGIFGLVAYSVYRISSLKPFLNRPTVEKTMLGLSMLTIILGSLIDNFIFYCHQMLYYPVAAALAYKLFSEQKETEHIRRRG